LCDVLPDGRTAFNLIQNALEHGDASLIFFVFDLLYLDGENLTSLPLIDRKTRLEAFLVGATDPIRSGITTIRSTTAPHSTGSPASTGSKGSSRSGYTAGTSPTAVHGSRRSA
jgi:ATP-dependent DNA ligase